MLRRFNGLILTTKYRKDTEPFTVDYRAELREHTITHHATLDKIGDTTKHGTQRGDLGIPGEHWRDGGGVYADAFSGAKGVLHLGSLQHLEVPGEAHGEIGEHGGEGRVGSDDLVVGDLLECDLLDARGGNVRGRQLSRDGHHVGDGRMHASDALDVGIRGSRALSVAEYAVVDSTRTLVWQFQVLPLLVRREPEPLLHRDGLSVGSREVGRLQHGALLHPDHVTLRLVAPLRVKIDEHREQLSLVRIVQVTALRGGIARHPVIGADRRCGDVVNVGYGSDQSIACIKDSDRGFCQKMQVSLKLTFEVHQRLRCPGIRNPAELDGCLNQILYCFLNGKYSPNHLEKNK